MPNLCERLFRGLWNTSNSPKYPKKLLPKKNYKLIEFDDLMSFNIIIVRRSLKDTKEETFDDFGFLRDDAMINKDIPRMSMNVLGGFFDVADIKFIQKKPASDDWEIGSKPPLVKNFKDCIEVYKNPIPIFFLLVDIHNIPFPYQKDKKTLPPGLSVDLEDTKKRALLNGIVKILHKPTLSNFWHIEFHLFEDKRIIKAEKNPKSISKASETNKERPLKEQSVGTQAADYAIRNIFKAKALPEIDKFDKIPEKYYKK
jgi:hypothetical protein